MNLFRRIYDKLFVNYSRINKEVSSNIESNLEILNSNISMLNEKILNLENRLSIINTYLLNSNYVNSELLLLKDRGKKKILLVGFYGAPNLGDELMLETLLQYFPSFDDIDLTVMIADNPIYDIGNYPSINFIHYPKTRYDFNYLAQYFDTLVFGGGAIIDDRFFDNNDSYKGELGTILIKLSERFIVWEKQIFCIGLSSIKSFSNTNYINKLSLLVEKADYFSVRDINSFNSLSNQCSCSNKKINIISDIVMANKNIKIFDKKNKNISSIGIVWIPYEENVASLKELLLSLSGKYKIHLIPFYGYCNFDISKYEQITSELNIDNVVIEKLASNMSELVDIFSKIDFLIAMRYHAVLIGNLLQIPTLPICYSNHPHYNNKMTFLSQLFNYSGLISIFDLDIDNIDKYIASVLKKFNDYKFENTSLISNTQRKIKDIVLKIVK